MNDEKRTDRQVSEMAEAEGWEFPPAPPLSEATQKRWDELRARGIITGGNPEGVARSFKPVGRARRPGALGRFLAERWGEG